MKKILMKEAKKKHLDIKTYSEALGLFSGENQVIAVSGIHGKTTTTALISFILTKANLDPSFIIGAGEVISLGTTGHYGKGDYFVLEADEYRKSPEDNTPKFFDLSPEIEIITSIEMDHPDVFASEEEVYAAFYKFACRIPRKGIIIICFDYSKAKKLQRSLADRNIETYGFQEGAAWQIINFQENQNYSEFSMGHKGEEIGPFKIKIAGKANVLNSAAAVIACIKIGLNSKVLQKILPDFKPVTRRFEKIGQVGETIIIDDYAHHPRAISMTLEAIKNKYPDYKIWCVFQPHTFSRTKELLGEFATAFKNADKVIITDIFSSARENEITISGGELANAIRQNQRNVRFIDDKEKIIPEIIDNLKGKDIIMTVGAGDIYKIGYKLLEILKDENKKN
ncbi:MAG: UDP-N-acetylmuramate--L-alanine ligase [Candidatus Berkelbacteria bacterium]|nr:UDP-N-acetylmuramate--L-alanine ligase [Candidatus Berkelbacteria bacterium]